MWRRIVSSFGLVLISAGAGFVGGIWAVRRHVAPLEKHPETIVAGKFLVLERDANKAAELDGLGLRVYGRDGRIRIALQTATNQKGFLALSDGRVDARARLGFIPSDTPSVADDEWGLQFRDAQGELTRSQ